MAAQIETAYVDLVRAIVRKQPTLMVLEDLHWGDSASVKLLDAALRELHDQPLVVLAFARPEVHDVFPKLWAGRNLTEIRLNPLNRRASEIFNHVERAAPEQAIREALAVLKEGNLQAAAREAEEAITPPAQRRTMRRAMSRARARAHPGAGARVIGGGKLNVPRAGNRCELNRRGRAPPDRRPCLP